MAKFRDMLFRRSDISYTAEEELEADTLKLLQEFNGQRTIFQVQQLVGLAGAVFKSSFLELFDKKLIEEIRTPIVTDEYVDESVLKRLREVIVEVAGPVGELLIADATEDLDLELARIPVTRISELVTMIAKGIPGDKQRGMFMEVMSQEIAGI